MIGKYAVRVRNSRNEYSFELKRNITVLCGDSGRGKTTLFEMISEYNRFGKSSGVSVSCDRRIVALGGDNWESEIERCSGCIIVIDEDSEFIRSYDFARAVRGSDNYSLLITRNYLSGLPYSVDEIYELTGRKNKKFSSVYSGVYRMFDRPVRSKLPFVPEVILTEDERAGYQFYKRVAEKAGIICISATGKSNIYNLLKEYRNKDVVVVADGAAFGADIRTIVEQQKLSPNKIAIFLPESFEWLILKSGAVDVDPDNIDNPENYADSCEYMSWEQYFTDLLIQSTQDKAYGRYKKESLPDYYTQTSVTEMIISEIPGLKLK